MKDWFSIESPVRLFEVIKIIEQCWSIQGVLGEYRLIKSLNPIAGIPSCRQGCISDKLKIWIEQSSAFDKG